MAPAPGDLSLFGRFVAALTRFSHRRPWLAIGITLVVLVTGWVGASGLKVKSNFVALLPSESAAAKRYLTTIERKGGSASTVVVVVESPSPEANRKYVDALTKRLREKKGSGIGSVEPGPGEAREFYLKNKWLFASLKDLAKIECEIDREYQKSRPDYLGLDDPCEVTVAEKLEALEKKLPEYGRRRERERRQEAAAAASAAPAGSASAAPAGSTGAAPASEPPSTDDSDDESTALQRFQKEMEARKAKLDRFPTGYFQKEDGTLFAVIVRTPVAGEGTFQSDEVYEQVKAAAVGLKPKAFHPKMEVGFGGNIPNGIEQRQALIQDIAAVSGLGIFLILAVIVLFFRSFRSLVHIGLCVFTGTGLAFAAAFLAYGNLNAATSFLAPIVAGNGINHSIVYMARYRERRRAGDDVEGALLDAALSVRKGTWLAALAASGSFGALLLTSFRGFSEFGLIGGVGMVTCWLATFLALPASLTLDERYLYRRPLLARLLAPLTGLFARSDRDGVTGDGAGDRGEDQGAPGRWSFASAIGHLTQRRPGIVLAITGVVTVVALIAVPGYVQDPWEYDFGKLGSARSRKSGAGQASTKVNRLFQRRGSPYLLLADDVSQVRAVAEAARTTDRQRYKGKYVKGVETVFDALGGSPPVVAEKLKSLEHIRTVIDKSRKRLKPEDKKIADEWRPPERLRALTVNDLPELVQLKYLEQKTGKTGTPVYVALNTNVSQSNGHNLLEISDLLESLKLPDGKVVPNASRASVFAEMIRSMERDGPRATLFAFLVVIVVTLSVTLRVVPATAVIAALLTGIAWTVGIAAWLNVRLNFLNFVALPLTFGICVEYSINLYERIRHFDGDVARGIGSAGGPVALCSLTTILGYASLITADSLALRSFGKYAIAGEIGCIITALLILPSAISALGGLPKDGPPDASPKGNGLPNRGDDATPSAG